MRFLWVLLPFLTLNIKKLLLTSFFFLSPFFIINSNPLTANYCSKCYKEHLSTIESTSTCNNNLKETENHTETINEYVNDNCSQVQINNEGNSEKSIEVCPSTVNVKLSDCNKVNTNKLKTIERMKPVKTIDKNENIKQNSNKRPAAQRCSQCKIRVGYLGFDCKCGNLFCGVHRYSDKHECSYDYRTEEKKKLETSNPVVCAAKLTDRV